MSKQKAYEVEIEITVAH